MYQFLIYQLFINIFRKIRPNDQCILRNIVLFDFCETYLFAIYFIQKKVNVLWLTIKNY